MPKNHNKTSLEASPNNPQQTALKLVRADIAPGTHVRA